MTAAQEETYNFIRDYIEQHRRSPMYHEIAVGLGITHGQVTGRVSALYRNGYIERPRYKHTPRGLRLGTRRPGEPRYTRGA